MASASGAVSCILKPLSVCRRCGWGWISCSTQKLTAAPRLLFIRSLCSTSLPQQDYQVCTPDGDTIMCYHPTKDMAFKDSKRLRPYKPALDKRSRSLTAEQIALVKKLRREDGSLWTVNTLARLFNVKTALISKVAPASLERQEELAREEELTKAMRPHRRKLHRAKQQVLRQKRLQAVLNENRYSFPQPKNDDTS